MKKFGAYFLVFLIVTIMIAISTISFMRTNADAVPTVSTDKPDYAPEETVVVTGAGFSSGETYAIPVIRPDGSIIIFNQDHTITPGWGNVTTDESGAFTYTYQLDGIIGDYTILVYPSTWDGDTNQQPIATTTFTDYALDSFTISPDPNSTTITIPGSLTFTLTATLPGGSGASTAEVYISPSPGTIATGVTVSYNSTYAYTFNNGTTIVFGWIHIPKGASSGSVNMTITVIGEAATGPLPELVMAWDNRGNGGTIKSSISLGLHINQYELSLATNPSSVGISHIAASPSSSDGFYDEGTNVTLTADSTVAINSSFQYVFDHWSGDAYGTSNSAMVTMDAVHSVTADYVTETLTTSVTITSTPSGSGFIKVDDLAYDAPHTFTWTIGSSHELEALSPVSGTTGMQYVFTDWSDGGNQSHNIRASTATSTYTALYDTYYKVSYNANVPVTVPADEWVKANASATGIFTSPQYSIVNTTKYAYLYDDRPSQITDPTTVNATYDTFYLVTFEQSGSDVAPKVTYNIDNESDIQQIVSFSIWVQSSHTISFRYESPVAGTSGTQFVLTGVDVSSRVGVSTPLTVTGTYNTQYQVTFNQSGVGSDFAGTIVTIDETNFNTTQLPYSFWWDLNSSHTFEFQTPLTAGDTQRYVWTSTSGLSTLQGGIVSVTDSGSIVGHYKTQYLQIFASSGLDVDGSGDLVAFTVDGGSYSGSTSPIGVSGGSFWVDKNSVVNYNFTNPVASTIAGKRYELYNLDGPVTAYEVSSSNTITGNYGVEYLLIVTSEHDSPNPSIGEHWYDSGTYINASVITPADETSGTRYRCTGHTGTGSTTSGPQALTSFSITEPSNLTWNWITQYYLTVNTSPITGIGAPFSPTGQDWYDVDTTAHVTAAQDITVLVDLSRYDFRSWTGANATGESDNDAIVVIDSAKTVTANYHLQYKLSLTQSGVGSDFSGTVLTVNGTDYDRNGFSAWADEGDVYEFTYEPTLVVTENVKRYVIAVALDPSPLTITEPYSLTISYLTQYYVTFSQSGVSSDFQGNVMMVEEINYTRYGHSAWYYERSNATFGFYSPLIVTANEKQYVLTEVNLISPLTITESVTVTGTYETQWYISITSAHGNPSQVSQWIRDGDSFNVSVTNPDIIMVHEHRWLLTGLTIDGVGRSVSDTVTYEAVHASHTIVFSWTEQWYVTFSQSGITTDFTGTVVNIDSTHYNVTQLSSSFWWNDASNHSFAFQSPLAVGTDKQYVWSSTDGLSNAQSESFSVTESGTITGNYYTLELTYNGSVSGQYSDPVNVTASLNSSLGPVQGVNITFTIGTQNAVGATDSNGTAKSVIVLNQPAGNYTVTATCAGAEGTTLTASKVFTIYRENANISYTGDIMVFTAGPSISSGPVHLAAHLVQEEDGYPGNLALANVTFALFKGTNLGGIPDLVFNAAVNTNGDAQVITTLTIDTWTVRVTIQHGNRYWQAEEALGVLNLAPGSADRSVTGGGWIPDPNSANGKGNFGFTVNYQKTGAAKGSFVYVFRGKDGFDYVVKSNSWKASGMGGLSFSGTNKAFFTGKCTIQKINRTTGELVESWGNCQFAVDITDGDLSNPRTYDTIAVTIYTSTDEIWRQIGTTADQIRLGGGNITIHK